MAPSTGCYQKGLDILMVHKRGRAAKGACGYDRPLRCRPWETFDINCFARLRVLRELLEGFRASHGTPVCFELGSKARFSKGSKLTHRGCHSRCQCRGCARTNPEGPSTKYLRSLVPNTITSMVFGTRNLKDWVLGPSGKGSLFLRPQICGVGAFRA